MQQACLSHWSLTIMSEAICLGSHVVGDYDAYTSAMGNLPQQALMNLDKSVCGQKKKKNFTSSCTARQLCTAVEKADYVKMLSHFADWRCAI